MGQAALFVGEPDEVVEERRRALREQRRVQAQSQAPRLVEPDRQQIELRPQDLDSLLPLAHRARSVWAVVERLDVRRFYEPIKARGSQAGGPARTPRCWSPCGCMRPVTASGAHTSWSGCVRNTMRTGGSAVGCR